LASTADRSEVAMSVTTHLENAEDIAIDEMPALPLLLFATVLAVGALAMLGGFFDMGATATPLQLGP
jgi:hypothetical protein